MDMSRYILVILFIGLAFNQSSGHDIELITEEGHIIILHPDRTWTFKEIKADTKGELDDGTFILVHPDKTWEYKLVDLNDAGKDILILQNGQEYIGNYVSKDEKAITFHVEKMPRPQTLPYSLISTVKLRNGNVIFESSSDKAFKEALKIQAIKKAESPTIEKSQLTYANIIDTEYVKGVKGGTSYDSYLAKNGALISIGDSLVIGSPATNNKQYYD